MNEQKNNGRGIFYGVIGVATLVVAIIGATFAYFTATAGNNVITGNMASINLSLDVSKVTNVDETLGGMIPMSNNMVEVATESTTNQICVDDNGNAVCQVYRITITNDSSAGQFVDGYVALLGGSGIEPTDVKGMTGVIGTDGQSGTYTYVPGALYNTDLSTANKGTTMRWAQVWQNTSGSYKVGEETKTETDYLVNGTQILGTASENVSLDLVTNDGTNTGDAFTHNRVNIRTNNTVLMTNDTNGNMVCDDTETTCTGDAKGVLVTENISGNDYKVIGTNYIRTSNHTWNLDGKPESYDRTEDVTSALVYNQNLAPNASATYYIVVWLSETGTNQTAGATVGPEGSTYTNPGDINFFKGNVTFVSAQGSEVSATFSSFARVESDQA